MARINCAEQLEESDSTSAQRGISTLLLDQVTQTESQQPAKRPDRLLAPLTMDVLRDELFSMYAFGFNQKHASASC